MEWDLRVPLSKSNAKPAKPANPVKPAKPAKQGFLASVVVLVKGVLYVNVSECIWQLSLVFWKEA